MGHQTQKDDYGVNKIKAKNYLNDYEIVEKSGDSQNTKITDPFNEVNN